MVDMVRNVQTFMATHGAVVFIVERARAGSRKLVASAMPVDIVPGNPAASVDQLLPWGRVPLKVRRAARRHFGV